MKTFNINHYVRIKLTPFGIETLRKNHEELRSRVPSVGEFNPPKADEDGFCEMQLWEIMNTFEEYLYNGAPNLPFEMAIQIEDDQFEN